jgi:hypothetical protein
MSPSRVILAIVSACFVLAHLSGGMNSFLGAFDINIDVRDIPYLMAIPGMAVFTLVMLRN